MEPLKGNPYGRDFGRLTAQSDIDRADKLTLLAMVFQAIILAAALIASPLFILHGIWTEFLLWIQPLIVSSWLVLSTLLILTYYLVHRSLIEDRIPEAKAASLTLGVLGLIAGGVIPGILLLIAYYNLAVAHTKIIRGSSPPNVEKRRGNTAG